MVPLVQYISSQVRDDCLTTVLAGGVAGNLQQQSVNKQTEPQTATNLQNSEILQNQPLGVLQWEPTLVVTEDVGQVKPVVLDGRGVPSDISLVQDLAVSSLLHRVGPTLQSSDEAPAGLLHLDGGQDGQQQVLRLQPEFIRVTGGGLTALLARLRGEGEADLGLA